MVNRATRLDMSKCPYNCSFSVAKLGAERAAEVHLLVERFPSETTFMKAAREIGFTPSKGSFYRHSKNHLKPKLDDLPELDASDMSHLQIIDQIIRQGARKLPQMDIGSKDLMDALKLHAQLTQGSVFDNFLDALAMGDEEEEEDGPESPEGLETAG